MITLYKLDYIIYYVTLSSYYGQNNLTRLQFIFYIYIYIYFIFKDIYE